MKKKLLIAFVLASKLFLPSFACAQGTLYASNLGQTTTGGAAVGSDSWIAQTIITGNNPNGYILNSIQLLMGSASGSAAGFTVSIYSNNSQNTSPTTDLGNLAGTDPQLGGVYTYATSGITLSPFTGYFIVVTAATPAAQGAFNWGETSYTGTLGNGSWQIVDSYFSSASGSTWTAHDRSSVFQTAIYATPVPEPSVCALGVLGTLVLCFHRRRMFL